MFLDYYYFRFIYNAESIPKKISNLKQCFVLLYIFEIFIILYVIRIIFHINIYVYYNTIEKNYYNIILLN